MSKSKAEIVKAWKLKNADHVREYRKLYYQKNRDKEIQQALTWSKANPNKVKESNGKYRAKNRESLNKKQKIYRLNNHEACLAKEPEKTRIYRAKNAKAKSDGHTIAELHQYWRDRDIDPKRCTYCDAWHTKWKNNWKTSQGDHVIPLHRGGTDTMDNMMPACWSCNSSKCDKLLSEWTQPKHEKKAA